MSSQIPPRLDELKDQANKFFASQTRLLDFLTCLGQSHVRAFVRVVLVKRVEYLRP